MRVPVSAASYAAAIEGLTRINERILGAGRYPPLYRSGVVYKREPRDVWRHAGDVRAAGWGDCEDLSAWRAAELRISGQDPRAHVGVYQSGPRRFHAIVVRGDGSTEDPSRRLGMLPGGRSPMGTLEGDFMFGQDDEDFEDEGGDDDWGDLDEIPEEPEEPEAEPEPENFDSPEEPFTSARERGQPIDAWPMTRPAPDEPIQRAPAQPMRPVARPAPRRHPKPKRRKTARRKKRKTKKHAKPRTRRRATTRRRTLTPAQRRRMQYLKRQRRARARAMMGYCVQNMRRAPIGETGAWIGIGDDPDVSGGAQVTFDLYRSGRGWSGIVRVPLKAIKAGRRQAIVAKTSPTRVSRQKGRTRKTRSRKAKQRTATKAIRLASKISRLPGVNMLIPPQARVAMKVLKSPIGKLATKGAGKLLSKLF